MDRDFTKEDFEKNKTMAALGYLVFFIPLIQCRDSKLGRYCANQGLILTALIVLVNVFFSDFRDRTANRLAVPARRRTGWFRAVLRGDTVLCAADDERPRD